MKISNASSALPFWRAVVWQSAPRPRKLGRHEGCAVRGKQVPKGSVPPFSCLALRPISQPLFIQVVEKRRGTVKGLYTPHSWKLIGLFTTHSVLCVRKCSSRSKPLRNLPHFPSSWPCFADDLKTLHSRHTYVVRRSHTSFLNRGGSEKGLMISATNI